MAETKTPQAPPHNEEAERAVLGAMFLDPNAVSMVQPYLRPDDFYYNSNRRVCEAIYHVFDAGHKADILTVTGELQKTKCLDEAGGLDYVASLSNVVPSSANVEYYAQAVQDCAIRRALIQTSGNIGLAAYDQSSDGLHLLEWAQQRLFNLSNERQNTTVKRTSELMTGLMEFLENAHKEKKTVTGVPSGFSDMDEKTTGFQKSEFIIIGARPSRGKTALALTMASNITIKNNIPAAFLTLEMSAQQLMMRILSSETQISLQKLSTGFFQTKNFNDILSAGAKMNNAPLYIVDMPNMRLLDLRAQARRLRAQQKVKIIFIDYLGLITTDDPRTPRYQQMADVSRSLKQLARELEIPIVALSQLTREAEKEKPSLASIRESGAIEQDADMVIFITSKQDKDKTDEEKDEEARGNVKLKLEIAKQRNGPTGDIDVIFQKEFTRFVPCVHERDER
ncbi:MAG: replicative DNA helicase [Treponema sp.]|nr:replicative DNA helicase [Treponema sp.]